MGGERVLWFRPADSLGEGFYLNANIRDRDGKVIFEITDNQWTVGEGHWDVRTSGNGILIRSRSRDIVLLIRIIPPETLSVERANIQTNGAVLKIRRDGEVITANGCGLANCEFYGSYIGIKVTENSVSYNEFRPRHAWMLSRLLITTCISPVF